MTLSQNQLVPGDDQRQPGHTDWRPNDREYAALLDALSRDLAAAEAMNLELDAAGPRPMADVLEAEERKKAMELSEARAARRAFAEAMDDLRAREPDSPGGEVAYDSRDPDQNARADVLVQYLVRTGYGEVTAEEPQPGAFVYSFSIKWAALRELISTPHRSS